MRANERAFGYLTRIIGVGAIAIFALFAGYLFYRGLQSFSISVLLPDGGELYPALIGTFYLVVLSVAFAVPVGIGAGVYIGVYARGRTRQIFSFLFELLASVPSIIIGLFGFALILMLHKFFKGALPSLALAAFSVAVLILPYIIKATQLGIEETPRQYIELAYGIGADTAQLVRYIYLPSAMGHIIKGVMLAFARSMEDTAVIMLTGAVASYGLPASMWEPFEALPFYIYTTTATYSSEEELGTIFVAAMILVLLAMVFVGLSGLTNEVRRFVFHPFRTKHKTPDPYKGQSV